MFLSFKYDTYLTTPYMHHLFNNIKQTKHIHLFKFSSLLFTVLNLHPFFPVVPFTTVYPSESYAFQLVSLNTTSFRKASLISLSQNERYEPWYFYLHLYIWPHSFHWGHMPSGIRNQCDSKYSLVCQPSPLPWPSRAYLPLTWKFLIYMKHNIHESHKYLRKLLII